MKPTKVKFSERGTSDAKTDVFMSELNNSKSKVCVFEAAFFLVSSLFTLFTNEEMRTRQCRKLLWGMAVLRLLN